MYIFKTLGWFLNFWASSKTPYAYPKPSVTQLILYWSLLLATKTEFFCWIWNTQVVNFPQTTNCIHCICEILLVLVYSKLKDWRRRHAARTKYQIFLSSNIVTSCSANLSLWNITAWKKCGLASVFSVTRAVCGTENVVKTSCEHRSGQRGPPSHNVNSRAPAALGCLNEESVKPTKIIYCVH